MQIREALHKALTLLLENQVPSAHLATELLLMHALGCDRAYLHSHPEAEVGTEALERYWNYVAQRSAGKPTQYITGHQEFWGLDFLVTPEVLIPRPETEYLVEAVLDLAQRQAATRAGATDGRHARLRIIDVGTGSGCIALALASEFPRAVILACDLSRRALAVASKNAVRLKMAERVKFLESDLLARFLDDDFMGSIDFVVSNPPYVARDELDKVQREVREFEPRLAVGNLESNDEIYRRLIPQAFQVLKPGGYLVMEIGYSLRDTVLALFGAEWTETEDRPDLRGIPRVVVARKRS